MDWDRRNSHCTHCVFRCVSKHMNVLSPAVLKYLRSMQSHFAVPRFSILSPDAFEKCDGSFLLIWVFQIFLLPRNTWKLSSITFHCCPGTENPSDLCSISTFFVSLIDFKSSGIVWKPHCCSLSNFSVQFYVRKKLPQLTEDLDCLFNGFYWFEEIVQVKIVLCCFAATEYIFRYHVPLVCKHSLRKLGNS